MGNGLQHTGLAQKFTFGGPETQIAVACVYRHDGRYSILHHPRNDYKEVKLTTHPPV